jgi:hypothetical protein
MRAFASGLYCDPNYGQVIPWENLSFYSNPVTGIRRTFGIGNGGSLAYVFTNDPETVPAASVYIKAKSVSPLVDLMWNSQKWQLDVTAAGGSFSGYVDWKTGDGPDYDPLRFLLNPPIQDGIGDGQQWPNPEVSTSGNEFTFGLSLDYLSFIYYYSPNFYVPFGFSGYDGMFNYTCLTNGTLVQAGMLTFAGSLANIAQMPIYGPTADNGGPGSCDATFTGTQWT